MLFWENRISMKMSIIQHIKSLAERLESRNASISETAGHSTVRATSGFIGRRFFGALTFLLLLSASFPVLSQVSPDGMEIIKHMVAVYHKANTVQDRAEARFTLLTGEQYIQTNVVKFKQPNRVIITTEDPKGGTFTVYANGKIITVYSGKQNIFTRRNSPADLKGTLDRVSEATVDTVNVPEDQMLSPLSFMNSNSVPREADSYKFVGYDNVSGHKTYKIRAQASLTWVQTLMPNIKIKTDIREIYLWVDVTSYMLLKSSVTLKVHSIDQNVQSRTYGFSFEETHSNTLLNTALRDDEFHFIEPKGAKQLFQNARPH